MIRNGNNLFTKPGSPMEPWQLSLPLRPAASSVSGTVASPLVRKYSLLQLLHARRSGITDLTEEMQLISTCDMLQDC